MTTARIINRQIIFKPTMGGTDTKLQGEESFNHYWAEYCRRNSPGFNITTMLLSLETAFPQPQNTLVSEEDIVNIPAPEITASQVSQRNLRLIKFLDQWITEPDDLGEEFWKKFCEDIEKNRFTI